MVAFNTVLTRRWPDLGLTTYPLTHRIGVLWRHIDIAQFSRCSQYCVTHDFSRSAQETRILGSGYTNYAMSKHRYVVGLAA